MMLHHSDDLVMQTVSVCASAGVIRFKLLVWVLLVALCLYYWLSLLRSIYYPSSISVATDVIGRLCELEYLLHWSLPNFVRLEQEKNVFIVKHQVAGCAESWILCVSYINKSVLVVGVNDFIVVVLVYIWRMKFCDFLTFWHKNTSLLISLRRLLFQETLVATFISYLHIDQN